MKKPSTATVYLILLFILVSTSCSRHMSIQQAKKITTSFANQRFTPPPRTITDITDILERKTSPAEKLVQYKRMAASKIPEKENKKKQAMLYLKRGNAKFFLGLPSIEDFRTAFELVKDKKGFLKTKKGFIITWALGKQEFTFGSAKEGLALMESARKNFPYADATGLVGRYAAIGDFEAAEKAIGYTLEKIKSKKKKRRKEKKDRPQQIMSKNIVTAELLEFKGRYKEAEPYHRTALSVSYQLTDQNSFYPISRRTSLAQNLIKQKKYLEAEVEARKALKEGLAIAEKPNLAKIITILSIILAKQDRLDDAEILMRKLLQILNEAGHPEHSINLAKFNYKLGQILVAQKKWTEALSHFQKARTVLKDDLKYAKFFLENEDYGLALLKTGQIKESINAFQQSFQYNKKIRGKKAKKTKRILSFIGVAHAAAGNVPKAMTFFRQSIPQLMSAGDDHEMNRMKLSKLNIIFSAYIDLLIRISGTESEKKYKINALDEAFRIADMSRSQTVQAALAKSGVRAALSDPELSDYARREQDAQMQCEALKTALSNQYALPENQQSNAVINKLKGGIKLLEKAQAALKFEIRKKFPDYAALSKPKPADFRSVQNNLQKDEALLSFFIRDDKTYIWAIPQKGDIVFAVSDTGKKEIERSVERLRTSLDIPVRTFGDIPDFDLSTAHALYNAILKPVEKGFNNSKQMIIVAHDALNQLPFSLLITKPFSATKDPDALFSVYKKVPWFIHRMAVTNMPSAGTFNSLRRSPIKAVQQLPFIGFGDPVFNNQQKETLATSADKTGGHHSEKAPVLSSRGVRIVKNIEMDTDRSASRTLEMLQRLPDTSEEVVTIASILGADPETDVFLHQNASEERVKSMDLSNRKVVLFSTHALVSGDLDGLMQPAIALSSPTVTGTSQDGLLTMDEIMGLRLNAEWVVLSACNTAAAEGEGAEAVSGLGRAFFYAGTRAVLVSNWSVETTSAKALVTELFKSWKGRKNISRGKALQQAQLKLIQEEGLTDAKTKQRISYAHPFFWAPFTLVGDGVK